MNRIDRLTGMILLLQGQRVITAEQIAAHFEISVRTVYRDLAALGEAGVPISSEPGIGYSLMRGYVMPPVHLTPDEAAALFLSGEVAEQIADDSLRAALRSALLKVRSILPQDRKDYLNRLRNAIGVRLRRPEDAAEKRESLMPIQDAIARRRCLAIEYNTANRGALTRRVVEPLGLAYYSRQWHLIAWCRLRQDARDFRLDRIGWWEVLEESYAGHEDFSLRDFLSEPIEREELTPVSIAIRPEVAERFRAEVPCTRIGEERLPDGRLRFDLLAYSLCWLVEWVLGFGLRVEVLAPAELREAIHEAALAVAGTYAAGEPEKAGSPG